MKKILFTFFFVFLINSCSESPTKSDHFNEIVSFHDFEYVDNTFFFVDHYYRERFESAVHNGDYIYEEGKEITDLHVWISIDPTDAQAVEGGAVLDPLDPAWDAYQENYANIPDVAGEAEGTTFKYLSNMYYTFDPYRGFLRLKHSVAKNEILAVSYTLGNGEQIGTNVFSDTIATVLLKLIKPRLQIPWDPYKATWLLVMRNVYYLGDSVLYNNEIKLTITDSFTGSIKDASGNSYLNLTGLDLLDESGTPTEQGDGKLDFINFNIFDAHNGLLIFPGLQPFDPLPNSNYQILEEKRAKFYNTTNLIEIQKQSRFIITLSVKE